MHLPHPWRELRGHRGIVLHWTTELAAGTWGATDGESIWLRRGLLQTERRCTLAHELEHIRRGHTSCQPEAVEAAVRHAAARALVPSPHDVAQALLWANGCLHQGAEELWLDHPTMVARVDWRHLHPAERVIIAERLHAEGVSVHHEGSEGAR